MKPTRLLLLAALSAILAACSSTEQKPPTVIPSTQTTDSAPQVPDNLSHAPDAVPQPVTRTRAGNKSPYTVLGKTYTLLPDSRGYRERGNASWYGTKFHGRRTANGEVYDMWAMTAAHKTLPIPSYVRVTNVANGRSVIVKVNDRGPFHSDRIIDMSYGAALKLGFADKGVAQVDVVDVTPVAGQATASPTLPVEPSPVESKPVSPPVVTATVPTVSAPVSNKGDYYQIGAFKEASNATRLQQKLSGLLSVPVYITPNDDKTWHRVRVGPITNTQANAETRQVLFEQGFKNLKLIKRP